VGSASQVCGATDTNFGQTSCIKNFAASTVKFVLQSNEVSREQKSAGTLALTRAVIRKNFSTSSGNGNSIRQGSSVPITVMGTPVINNNLHYYKANNNKKKILVRIVT
jgi:hypothetical protein